MAAQAKVKQITQYIFPEGASVAELKVNDGTVISAGSIQSHATDLDMRRCEPMFEEGAISPSFTTLFINDLVKGSFYPTTLKRLFIRDYSGSQPLPQGLEIYVHANDRKQVSLVCEHHLFLFAGKVPDNCLDNEAYTYEPQVPVRVFGTSFNSVKCVPKQYCFPEGECIAKLSVELGHIIKAGVIPPHVTDLDMRMSEPIFEQGAIPSTLKYLNIKDLTKGSIYPDTLSLFVRDYTGSEPVPAGPKVFINVDEADKVSRDSEHYLFIYGCALPLYYLQSPDYDHGLPVSECIFGEKIAYAKRTPKSKAQVPAPVDTQPKLAEEQAKLAQAKRELVIEKQKLTKAKLELKAEQLKALHQI